MRKSILSLLTWSLPFLLIAQSNTSTQSMVTKEGSMATEGKGIHWTTGLSWEEIKQKAKAENKHIFIDAYTTWCGPCKIMDKEVFPNDNVGDFFNEHFIAVKAQMNVTEKDDEAIKSWYDDAEKIAGDYTVLAYPCLIFLSPDATLLYKIEGFRPVQKFVDTAKLVLTNGTVYNDPYKEYKTLVSEYKKGIKHYDRMPDMILKALQLHDANFAREVFNDHLKYASTLNEKERYTKENIELWSPFTFKLDSKALQFFLKDGDKIDQVMGQKGWSTHVVDRTIQGRIVDSFFKMQRGETITRVGKIPNSEVMFKNLPRSAVGKIEPDLVEADWKKLEKMIRTHFSKDYATRNVLTAKIRWYYQHENILSASKAFFIKLKKYPPEDMSNAIELGKINQSSWETFLYSNDKKLLKKALVWMNKIIQHGANESNMLDTYANLLYKLGRTKEAMQWERKAVSRKTEVYGNKFPNEFEPTLEKMKKGERTYEEQGAIWLK